MDAAFSWKFWAFHLVLTEQYYRQMLHGYTYSTTCFAPLSFRLQEKVRSPDCRLDFSARSFSECIMYYLQFCPLRDFKSFQLCIENFERPGSIQIAAINQVCVCARTKQVLAETPYFLNRSFISCVTLALLSGSKEGRKAGWVNESGLAQLTL